MMEDAAIKLVTLYGPLGLGWLVSWVLWKRLEILTDKFVTASADTVAVMTRLETKLDARRG